MKSSKKLLLPALAILSVVVLGGCKKDLDAFVQSPVKDSSVLQPYLGTLAAVNLGIAGEFVILSKSGITNVFQSAITGDIGTSPITGAALLVSCAEVSGTIYTVDAAGPLPCRVTNASRLTTAVGDMQTAYTDAAGRSKPNFLNLGAGNIGGKTLTPGLYKFTSAVVIPTDVTISGGANDIFIFQVAWTLTMSAAVKISFFRGPQRKNIFWEGSKTVAIGTTKSF